MLKRNRGSDPSLGILIALGVIVAAIVVWGGIAWSGLEQRQQSEQSQSAANDSHQDIREQLNAECIRGARDRTLSCTFDAPSAPENEDRAIADLKAQQDMARFTLGMLFASGVGTIITFAGVLYVAWTLGETRKANAAFAAHSRRELRAYMVLEALRPETAPSQIRVKPIWKNTGSTPTRHARANCQWKYFSGPIPEGFAFADRGTELNSTVLVGPDQSLYGEGVKIPMDAFLQAARVDGASLLVYGWVEYCDIFGDTPMYRTEFAAVAEIERATAWDYEEAKRTPELVFVVEGHRLRWLSYGKHNSADADCFTQPAQLAERKDGRVS